MNGRDLLWLLLFLTVASPGQVRATSPAATEGMVEGRVRQLKAHTLVLESAGQSVTLTLDASTKFVGPRLRTAHDLKSGRQVRVQWKRLHGQRLATRVEELQPADAGPAPRGTSVPDQGLTPPSPSPGPAGKPAPGGGSELPHPGSSPPDLPPSGTTPELPPTGTPPSQRPR